MESGLQASVHMVLGWLPPGLGSPLDSFVLRFVLNTVSAPAAQPWGSWKVGNQCVWEFPQSHLRRLGFKVAAHQAALGVAHQ